MGKNRLIIPALVIISNTKWAKIKWIFFYLGCIFFYPAFEIGFDMIEVEVFEGEIISLRINQTNDETTGSNVDKEYPPPGLTATSGTAISMTLYKINEGID